MRFRIEECRSADDVSPFLPWVERAVEAVYPEEAEPRSFEAARRFLLKSLGRPDALFLVARGEEEGRFAGLLFIARREDPFLGTSFPFVYALFTAPEFRRLGVGAALLSRGETIVKQRGGTCLVSLATHNDDAIISMGERRGYLRERGFMIKEL